MMYVIDSGARKNCDGHLLMERGQGFMWIRVRMLLRPSMECCRLYFYHNLTICGRHRDTECCDRFAQNSCDPTTYLSSIIHRKIRTLGMGTSTKAFPGQQRGGA